MQLGSVYLRPSAPKAIALVLGLFLIIGCGGNGSSGSSNPTQAGTSNVQINMGDAPADWIVAFTMNMSSVALINSNGTSVNVASGAMQMEMRHLMGTMQPLSMANVPQGTYSMANISISSANVTYMDSVTRQPVQKTMPGMTKTVNFNPPVTVGSTPMVMNFDLDLAHSISADSAGNMTFTPVFNMTTGVPGGGLGPQYGGMDHIIGSVSGVSGSSFTISMMPGLASFTVMTNSSTQFEHMTGMGSLSAGMMVDLDANMQADGSLMATRIDSVLSGMSGGMMAEGLVNSISGNPPTQLSIIADNGAGSGMMGSYLGATLLVNVAASTGYRFDASGVDLKNLPFTPTFNSSTMTKGQRIDPGTSGGMMNGGMMGPTMNASELTLEQQGLSGTVASYASGSPASFILNLPADSAFTSITGSGMITVFQQPDTQLRGMPSVANGASVQVRGLLFFDAGSYKMVAARIISN